MNFNFIPGGVPDIINENELINSNYVSNNDNYNQVNYQG